MLCSYKHQQIYVHVSLLRLAPQCSATFLFNPMQELLHQQARVCVDTSTSWGRDTYCKGALISQFTDTTDSSTLTSKYWPVPVPIPITTDVITEALN